jgi:predicted transposase/invertase (TIGR01784 family)
MVDKEIFPEYFLITVERYKNIIAKRIDEWIYIFKNNEVAQGSSSKNIDKAEQKLAEINMSDEERKRYEKYLINFIRDNDVLNTARNEGEMKGKIEIAKKMKTKGKPIEEIIEFTGLSENKILEL